MTRNRTPYESALRRYEELVPQTATVAVHLPPDSYEYPLFGPRLERRLIPINSFRLGRQSLPADADVMLFSSALEKPVDTDVWLGTDWYLRPLQADARR
jgi:hypothetical protein